MQTDNASSPNLDRLTADDVDRLSYPELVALVRETNRCPGGKRTINRIARLTLLDRESRVLEVGCTTGFTSIELAAISRARILGVDVIPAAVAEAERRRRALPASMAERIEFRVADLFDLLGRIEPVDLVVVGGATTFMQRKQDAVQAYQLLLRPYGFLSVTTLFYRSEPPQDIVQRVGNIIGTRIDVKLAPDWLDLFTSTGLELYHCERHELDARPPEVIDAYVRYMLMQPHLNGLCAEARAALHGRWLEAMTAFNENHRYLGYLLALLRRNPFEEQPELFLPRGTIVESSFR
ncbi:MAG TPA: class I SAM-dependent methyltransferase [Thermoanaerobaculia bacterium]|nr:class I SAM-dependent methyltransferase [Thermoanaerobaculia bacterium]